MELGRKAAAEARKTLPLMRDDNVTSFVQDTGRRLVAAIPQDLQHPEFQYTFEVVNVKEINAFALPGGPMFVNRGMIEAAHNDGEVAGVMAHELSHVLLRHGTAQASKATKYEVGQVAGAVLGAIIGGGWGQIISQGTQFGLGTAFLRFSREYERDADIEGAQIMARAGYDPNDMANMFKTIQKQGGSGGPQWLSDHPDPGDRSAYIAREARSLRVVNPDPRHAGVRAGAVAPEADVAGADHRAGDQDRGPHRQRGIERRGAAERTGGTALPELPDLHRRPRVPHQRAVQLA